MPGKKADAEAFASKWANKGIENQDTQRFWIDFYQNVLGVEDAVSRLEFEKPVSTDASAHDGYIDVFIPSAKTLIEQKSLGIDLAKEETRQGRKVTPAKQGNAYAQGMPLSQQPRYIIACNFSDFWVFDRERFTLPGASLQVAACRTSEEPRRHPVPQGRGGGPGHDLPRRFRRGRQDHVETSRPGRRGVR